MDKSQLAVSSYEKIAGKYTRLYYDDKSDLKFFDKFTSFLSPKAKVLDIGCGPGTFTQHFVKNGFDVEGIDLSSTMVGIAKKKLPEIKFQLMDMRQMDFPENKFDAIFSAYSLIHIPSEEVVATLKEFWRVLKKGGILGLITQKGEADKIVDEPMDPGEKMFFNFFTKQRLQKFLIEAGFDLEYQEEAVLDDAEGSGSDRVIYTVARK